MSKVSPQIPAVMLKSGEPCKLTRRRWLILTAFSLYALTNQFQWISYSTINDKIAAFYDVRPATVDWLSMVYMVVYIILVFPATWLLDRKGLRLTAYLGAFANVLGAAIKCFSPYSDRFIVTFVGQTLCAISQVFTLGLPARIASVWFAEKEVPFATSVAVFGTQLGVAVGFLVPLIVPSVKNVTLETDGISGSPIAVFDPNLAVLYYVKTGIAGALFILIIIVFKDKPEYPPNPAQAAILDEAMTSSYTQWIADLFRNLNFDALLLTFGMMTGSFYAIGTLLNQLILYYFEGQTENAGYTGMTLVLAGLVASVLFGLILSWTGKYKETTFAIYVCSLACMIIFMITLSYSNGLIWPIFITAGALGFFMTGYMPVGYELAAEITYPAPEGTSSGLLNCSAQIFGVTLTLGMGDLLTKYGPLVANGLIVALIAAGTVVTYFIKSDLRRTRKSNERHQHSTLEMALPHSTTAVSTLSGMDLANQ